MCVLLPQNILEGFLSGHPWLVLLPHLQCRSESPFQLLKDSEIPLGSAAVRLPGPALRAASASGIHLVTSFWKAAAFFEMCMQGKVIFLCIHPDAPALPRAPAGLGEEQSIRCLHVYRGALLIADVPRNTHGVPGIGVVIPRNRHFQSCIVAHREPAKVCAFCSGFITRAPFPLLPVTSLLTEIIMGCIVSVIENG